MCTHMCTLLLLQYFSDPNLAGSTETIDYCPIHRVSSSSPATAIFTSIHLLFTAVPNHVLCLYIHDVYCSIVTFTFINLHAGCCSLPTPKGSPYVVHEVCRATYGIHTCVKLYAVPLLCKGDNTFLESVGSTSKCVDFEIRTNWVYNNMTVPPIYGGACYEVCVHVCVHACVRACVRVCVHVLLFAKLAKSPSYNMCYIYIRLIYMW